MPPTAPPQRRRWLRGHVRAVVAALVAVAVLTPAAYLQQQRAMAEQLAVNQYLQGEITRVQTQIRELANLKAENEAIRLDLEHRRDWKAQRQWPARLLRLAAEARPPAVWFEQVQDTPTGIRMAGRARSYDDVAALAKRLAQSELLHHVDIASLQRDERGGGVKFSLDAEVVTAWRPLEREDHATRPGPRAEDPR